MIKFLCFLKVNSIASIAFNKASIPLVSQALIDMEITHEEFIAIFKEKDK